MCVFWNLSGIIIIMSPSSLSSSLLFQYILFNFIIFAVFVITSSLCVSLKIQPWTLFFKRTLIELYLYHTHTHPIQKFFFFSACFSFLFFLFSKHFVSHGPCFFNVSMFSVPFLFWFTLGPTIFESVSPFGFYFVHMYNVHINAVASLFNFKKIFFS